VKTSQIHPLVNYSGFQMSAYSFENKESIPVRFLRFHFAVGKMKTAIKPKTRDCSARIVGGTISRFFVYLCLTTYKYHENCHTAFYNQTLILIGKVGKAILPN
ncbi:MAG: hypothetical protein ACKPCM_12955, partial [Pseudanabaena sp.]